MGIYLSRGQTDSPAVHAVWPRYGCKRFEVSGETCRPRKLNKIVNHWTDCIKGMYSGVCLRVAQYSTSRSPVRLSQQASHSSATLHAEEVAQAKWTTAEQPIGTLELLATLNKPKIK